MDHTHSLSSLGGGALVGHELSGACLMHGMHAYHARSMPSDRQWVIRGDVFCVALRFCGPVVVRLSQVAVTYAAHLPMGRLGPEPLRT